MRPERHIGDAISDQPLALGHPQRALAISANLSSVCPYVGPVMLFSTCSSSSSTSVEQSLWSDVPADPLSATRRRPATVPLRVKTARSVFGEFCGAHRASKGSCHCDVAGRRTGGTVTVIMVDMSLVTVPVMPLKATCAPERLVPVMVTTVPVRPNDGVNPVIVGAASVNCWCCSRSQLV